VTGHDERRVQALKNLQRSEVLTIGGHFDYGNGYHGRVYVNPHQLFQHPSTIWQVAQDLIDVLPDTIKRDTEIVAGPATGGALLAHTIAGLLDSRRSLSAQPCGFAPFTQDPQCKLTLRDFYAKLMAGRRVLIADDVRNTGKTFQRCADLVRAARGQVIATVEIYDRMESIVDLGVPNIALIEHREPDNYPAETCPLCRDGAPITRF